MQQSHDRRDIGQEGYCEECHTLIKPYYTRWTHHDGRMLCPKHKPETENWDGLELDGWLCRNDG